MKIEIVMDEMDIRSMFEKYLKEAIAEKFCPVEIHKDQVLIQYWNGTNWLNASPIRMHWCVED